MNFHLILFAHRSAGSHLSLNIGSGTTANEKPQGQGSYSRSPKLISRFLRSSFAKIMSIKGGNDSNNDDDFSHSEAAEEHLSPDVKVRNLNFLHLELEYFKRNEYL